MSNSEEIKVFGRLVGRSVAELHFRAFRDASLSIGEIVIAADETTGRKFLLRVTDVSYGHESGEANWAEKAAGRMMEQDARGQTFRLHDADRRLYKLVKCASLGFIEDGRFHRPRSLPTHFSMVFRPDRATMEFLSEYSGDLIIGNLRCGEAVLQIPLGLDGNSLGHHLGIFATTGMGKSNLTKVLAAAALESGAYGMLIFDPHGEYHDGGQSGRRGLKDHPAADHRLCTYSRRKLSGRSDLLTISATEIRNDDIKQLFSFSQAQYEALHAVASRFGSDWLMQLKNGAIEDLSASMSIGGSFHEATLHVLKRRAERIFGFRTINSDSSLSTVGNIVNRLQQGQVILIDTANLSQDEETLVTTVIARSLLENYRHKYQSGRGFDKLPQTLILLEEAQRVLAASIGDSNIFHRIAREGRKFKVGLGVVTQQPKLLSEELLSQLNSIFVLGLADERDRAIVRSSAKQDISALGTEIQTLGAGEALLTSPTLPFAVPLRIYLYESYLESLAQIERPGKATVIPDRFFD